MITGMIFSSKQQSSFQQDQLHNKNQQQHPPPCTAHPCTHQPQPLQQPILKPPETVNGKERKKEEERKRTG